MDGVHCTTAAPARRDRLTIRRLLLLTAGLGVGLGVFTPDAAEPPSLGEPDFWLMHASAVLLGLILPGPLFAFPVGRAPGRILGPGTWFVLVGGLGTWLLLPPSIVARVTGVRSAAPMCLAYVLPLLGAWFVLARLLVARPFRGLFAPEVPWVERYGTLLMLLWTPLGVWHLVQFYLDVMP